MRIGIFGGSFNPPHNGHLNSLQTVQKKAGLDRIYVIPNSQNPLKLQVEGPTPNQRFEMVAKMIEGYGDAFIADDREIRRGGISYTIDSIREFRKTNDAEDIYLIIGADNFENLNEWKDWKSILTESNLIVTTRPGFEIPTSTDEMPTFLSDLVIEADFNFVELKTGRNIQFISLKDVDASSSEIRKKLRVGRPVQKDLPLAVESYIRDTKIYRPVAERISDYRKFTDFCAQILFEKKGINVRGFDLTGMGAPTDFALIASGTSTRHAAAMAENIMRAVKEEFNVLPLGIEGIDEARWVVVDYGALIIHVFYDFVRNEYALENLWKDAKDMGLKDTTARVLSKS